MKKLQVLPFTLIILTISFLISTTITFAQEMSEEQRKERCQNNQNRLKELGKQYGLILGDLFQATENDELLRDELELLNKAVAATDTSDAYLFIFKRENLDTLEGRKKLAELKDIPWKDEYGRNPRLLIRAIRDSQLRQIDRLVYLKEHQKELEKQQSDLGKQMAIYQNRMIELKCNESFGIDDPVGSEASSYPNLSGGWQSDFKGSWNSTRISQSGNELTFTNEFGNSSKGFFTSRTSVKAIDWENGLTATVSEDGKTIKWGNGTTWKRP